MYEKKETHKDFTYKDFEVIDSFNLEYREFCCFFLRHTSGFEVFHIVKR